MNLYYLKGGEKANQDDSIEFINKVIKTVCPDRMRRNINFQSSPFIQ